MNVDEYIEAHKDCPLSLFLAHVHSELMHERTLLGKAFLSAVLALL